MDNPIIRLGALNRLVRSLILPLSEDVSELKKQSGTSKITVEDGKIYIEYSEEEGV